MRVSQADYRRLTGKRPPARAARHQRHQPGEMNRLEAKYALELEYRKSANEIAAWWFERFKVKLAGKCFYTPDFLVQLADGTLELHEVKARWSNGQVGADDAKVKVKCVAEQFPFVVVVAVWDRKGGWTFERLGE